jgi:hypothetical protein
MLESLGLVRRQGREGLVDRAVPGLEDVDEMCRRAVPEIEERWSDRDLLGVGSKELLQSCLGTPKRRRQRAWRGRKITAEQPEDLTDESVRSPVGKADPSLGVCRPAPARLLPAAAWA